MTAEDVRPAKQRSGVFRTKSVEQSMKDTDEPDSKLRKPLSIAILDAIGKEAWSEARMRYLGEDSMGSP